MAIQRKLYFAFIIATLGIYTMYLKADMLLPTSKTVGNSYSQSSADDNTNEHSLDHHPTKHVPLFSSESLSSKQTELSLHDRKGPAP